MYLNFDVKRFWTSTAFPIERPNVSLLLETCPLCTRQLQGNADNVAAKV